MTEDRMDNLAARRPMPQLAVEARFLPQSFREADGASTVEVTVSAGSPVLRVDWWDDTRFYETLAIEPAAIRMDRINGGGAPVLADHNKTVDSVIGVVERAWIDGGELRAALRFSGADAAQDVARKVREGVLRNVSVGYMTHRVEVIPGADGGPATRRAIDWEPVEVSFVAVPADAQAGVREAPRFSACEFVNRAADASHHQEKVGMSEPNVQGGPEPAQKQPEFNAEAERAAIRAQELARVRDITAAARALGLEQHAQALIEDGLSLSDAQARLIAEAAKARQAQDRPAPAHIQVTHDEGDKVRAGVEAALEARLSHKPIEGVASEFRGATLVDMGRRLFEIRGVSTKGWSRAEMAQAMLGLPVNGRTMQTTSDFASLLANVQSKRLLASYMASARTFTAWTARRDLPDFKTTTVVELGAAPALQALAEGGSIQYGAVQDSGESYSLVRYARNVSLSYPAIVNDDLGGFDRMPMAFATAVANLENTVVYGILATNANMSDGTALFAAGHNNTAAGSMDVAGVTAARAQILRQTDPTGQRIMVMPSVIVVPVELAGTARALFSATVVPAGVATTAVNPWQGAFTLVETNFLTDTNDYYVTVAAGSGYEAVEVGYEAGASGPQLSSFTSPDVDGVVFSCRHSFGAKAVTWRTIARVTA